MMKVFCLTLLFRVCIQLSCDKSEVQAVIGGSLTVICQYQTKGYLFNQKYWCQGEYRSSCEILTNTDRYIKWNYKDRLHIHDAYQNGLFIIMGDLQTADSGVYWVGINKIYSDIMFKISVHVSEVPVSQPRVWSSNPPSVSCWGQSLTVLCASDRGTRIQYSWYRAEEPLDVKVAESADLQLSCGLLQESSEYYCTASNSMGNQRSNVVAVHVLRPAEDHCIYALHTHGDSHYDCRERFTTTSTAMITATTEESGDAVSLHVPGDFSVELGLPLWYEILRWLLLLAMLTTLYLNRWLRRVPGEFTQAEAQRERTRAQELY